MYPQSPAEDYPPTVYGDWEVCEDCVGCCRKCDTPQNKRRRIAREIIDLLEKLIAVNSDGAGNSDGAQRLGHADVGNESAFESTGQAVRDGTAIPAQDALKQNGDSPPATTPCQDEPDYGERAIFDDIFDDFVSGEFDGRKQERHVVVEQAAIRGRPGPDASVHAEHDGTEKFAGASPVGKAGKATDIECLEQQVIIDELRVVARKLNIEQSFIENNLHRWADSLDLLDGCVCFICDGERYGPESFLSAWLEKYHGCIAWLQKYGYLIVPPDGRVDAMDSPPVTVSDHSESDHDEHEDTDDEHEDTGHFFRGSLFRKTKRAAGIEVKKKVVDASTRELIWNAALDGDWETVKVMIADDSTLITVTGEAMIGNNDELVKNLTLLHLAAGYRDNFCISIVDFLNAHGADVHARDDNGWQPIHYATWCDPDIAIIKFFVAHGADVRSQDNGGTTPLHLATVENFNVAILEYLVAQGADIHARDNDGMSALHLAAYQNPAVAISEFLLSVGADISAKANDGHTPLHVAVASEYPSLEVLQCLLRGGADINARNADGETSLHVAVSCQVRHVVQMYLLLRGADVHARDNQGRKPSAHIDISELIDDGNYGVLWFLRDPELFGMVDVTSALESVRRIHRL
jgi:ankyrin repeat protein